MLGLVIIIKIIKTLAVSVVFVVQSSKNFHRNCKFDNCKEKLMLNYVTSARAIVLSSFSRLCVSYKQNLSAVLLPFTATFRCSLSLCLRLFVAMRRIKQAFCALKEHSSVSYAKMATFGGFCDLDLIIVKATAPDDFPLPEKYVNEILKIFSISSSSFHSFSLSFTRRFGRTHCWKVALKCLILLHRLLRSLPEYSPFRAELLYARSNGLLSLYPCNFRDDSSSKPEDYTMFIRSYAQLLHEALDCFSFDRKVTKEEGENEQELRRPKSIQEKMKEANRTLEVLPQLQSLMDRVMDCRPTGVAAKSFIVQSAMIHIIRDSFICYTSFRKEIVLVMDNLIEMPYRSCISSFGIYKKAAMQAEQLCDFYDWCKAKGLCGSYEYPFIEKIPLIQIRALESFLNGMWQITESSSSATSPSSWVESNKSSSIEDEEADTNKQQMVRRDIVVSNQWVKFEENYNGLVETEREESEEEMAPLIQLEDEENDNWEVLLDASLNLSRVNNGYLINSYTGFSNGYGGRDSSNGEKNNPNNNASNPFCQPYYKNMPNCYRWYHASDPTYPWGL